MINVAITGADTLLAGELIRILVNHPDVELSWLAAPAHGGEEVARFHKGLVGETSAVFADAPGTFDDIDIIYQADPAPGAGRALLAALPHDVDVKIIDLSPDFRDESEGFVYGLCELNRRRIVHDCTRVACPSPIAAAALPALLPLARNLLLGAPLTIIVEGDTLPDGDVAAEVARALRQAQSSFGCDIDIVARTAAVMSPRALVLRVETDCGIDEALLDELYDKYFDDHNFTFPVKCFIGVPDVLNTNKCLLRLARHGQRVTVDVVADAWLKGGAGNAVHVMNLLCGLHERVGLHLKASLI